MYSGDMDAYFRILVKHWVTLAGIFTNAGLTPKRLSGLKYDSTGDLTVVWYAQCKTPPHLAGYINIEFGFRLCFPMFPEDP